MKVEFHNQTEVDTKEITKLIRKIFKTIEDEKKMHIIFVDNASIQSINKTYRNIDKPTDVISFPNDEEDDDSLGDIFISIEKAIEQASDYGHSFEREIGFLSVHGYLHLKGYDHHTKEEEKVMFTLQEEILKKANLTRKSE
ncbi:MAG TPA: rRNA maturation RNase YbeY [Acholeplasma sp.]|jgi:probable rRNA maturation factor